MEWVNFFSKTKIQYLFFLKKGAYANQIKTIEEENKEFVKKINNLCGIKESDTGLALPATWDLVNDKNLMKE